MEEPNPSVKLIIHYKIGDKEDKSNDVTEDILSKIQEFRANVSQLCAETIEYQKLKDQYNIHFQQYKNDQQYLREQYKKLKFEIFPEAPQPSIPVEQIFNQQQVSPLPPSNPFLNNNISQNVPVSNSLSQMQQIQVLNSVNRINNMNSFNTVNSMSQVPKINKSILFLP